METVTLLNKRLDKHEYYIDTHSRKGIAARSLEQPKYLSQSERANSFDFQSFE